jgi:hypothetical protein
MANFSFDASSVAPQVTNGVLPAGTYLAHITESDIRPLASGNGQGLKLTLEIIDGQHKGRRVWDNLNIQHSSETTQRIAQAQLSALCHAVNVIKLEDTSALHYKPVRIKVTVREAQGQYQESNNIKSYESSAGVTPTHSAQVADAPVSLPTSKAPAWAKKG